MRKIALQLLNDGQVRIKNVQRLLGKVSHHQAGAQFYIPAVRLRGPGNHLKQRTFSRAVSSHHRPALAAAEREIQTSRSGASWEVRSFLFCPGPLYDSAPARL